MATVKPVNCNDVVRVELKINGNIIHIFEKVCNEQKDITQFAKSINAVLTAHNSLFQFSRTGAAIANRKG